MTMNLKKRTEKTVCRIDQESFSATANVAFKTVFCTFDGDGSEIYDYEGLFRLDGTGTVNLILNDFTSYSQDYMQGRGSTTSANTTATVTSIPLLRCDSATYTSMCKIKITGSVGSKRHIQVFQCGQDGATLTRVASFYTADTTTEITSLSFVSTSTQTVILTAVINAVPKIQYNPHAILLSNLDLTSQTADIIFGGVNDTEGVYDLDGDVYNYVAIISGTDAIIIGYINSDTVTSRSAQLLTNNGNVSAVNFTPTYDFYAYEGDGEVFVYSDVGRKKITISSTKSYVRTLKQRELYTTNPDTSTKMTSLMLRPLASVSGNVQLYAVKKGDNADLTPWCYLQKHTVDNADFSTGKSFNIKPDALFARIQIKGYSASGSNIEIDFDTTTLIKQYLKSSSSSTSALFATNRTIGKIQEVSTIDCWIALKSGANRPILSKSNYNENTIDCNYLLAVDTSTDYTQITLSADNTNLMDADISVSFY